jgi:hypothetical protein
MHQRTGKPQALGLCQGGQISQEGASDKSHVFGIRILQKDIAVIKIAQERQQKHLCVPTKTVAMALGGWIKAVIFSLINDSMAHYL